MHCVINNKNTVGMRSFYLMLNCSKEALATGLSESENLQQVIALHAFVQCAKLCEAIHTCHMLGPNAPPAALIAFWRTESNSRWMLIIDLPASAGFDESNPME